MKLPITILIRTLNEEANIEECIKYCLLNNPLEIIVVDGDSNDRTINIVESINNVKLIRSKKGLALQRDQGILHSSPLSKYIAIVDADDRLDKDCLKNLYADLEKLGAVAAQAKHESLSILTKKTMTYWEKAMLVNLKVIRDLDNKISNNIEMIGRPALYRKDALWQVINDSDYKYSTAAEDADLAYKLKKLGAEFTIGTGITYRKHLSTFRELYKRWLSYGSGDAKFIQAHPERKYRVLKHLLYVYPIKRSYYCAMKFGIRYTPFFILQGWVRFFGMLKYLFFGIGKVDNYKDKIK